MTKVGGFFKYVLCLTLLKEMIKFDYYVLNWIFNHQVDDGLFFAWEVALVQNKNAVFLFCDISTFFKQNY